MKLQFGPLSMLLLGASAMAQDDSGFEELLTMDLDALLEVEVATGTPKQLSEAPAVVSVITAEEIRSSGARTFAEALERVPGLHIAASVNRAASMVTIRGIQTDNTPQILILMDGVELSEITSFSVPYSFRLPVNFIERIEIIRGPGSAVYGADAFSGVVNIITRATTNENEMQVGASYGSFDTVETWLNGNFTIDDLKVGFSYTFEKANNDADRLTPYGVMQRNREIDNFHLTADYGNFSIKNWFWRLEQKMGTGAGIFANDIDLDIADALKFQLNWDNNISDDLSASFDVSYSKIELDASFQLFPPGVWPVGNDGNLFFPPFTPVDFPDGVIGEPQLTSERTKLNSAFIYSGARNHRIRIGLGYEKAEALDIREFKNFGPGVLDVDNIPDDPDGPDGPLLPVSDVVVDVTGTPFIYSPDYTRELWYLSLQDEWTLAEGWELTAGVRYDDYSDFGGTTNPRLALVWQSTETITSKLLFGTAFRAPKTSELAFINNPTTIGNPDLDPEKIKTVELAFDYRPNDDFSGQLNIFRYEAEDLIQLSNNVYQNTGEQDGQGIEVEATWHATKTFRFVGNYSYLDSELPLTGEDKAQVPGHMVYTDVQYQFASDWLITMQNYWIGDRKRQLGDLRPEVDDYLKTDVTLLWEPSKQWRARLSVRNLFNDDIREPTPDSGLFSLGLGFPEDIEMESRSIFGNVVYSF